MQPEKIIVNIDPATKEIFMRGCADRMMSASAVLRHLIELQIDAWEGTAPDVLTKIESP